MAKYYEAALSLFCFFVFCPEELFYGIQLEAGASFAGIGLYRTVLYGNYLIWKNQLI